MADRTVYNLTFSENGWRMVDQGSCVWVTVPGASVTLQIREGQPAAIMGAFAADFNAYVEPLRDADSACWTATNSVASSNHLSGTAMDLNWNSHPMGKESDGYSPAEVATVREMLDFYEGMIFWGNDWNSPKDSMHFQMGYDTYGSDNVARVQDFIARKIRADGFSTFRRGNAPETSSVLSQAMGGTLGVDYPALAPAVSQCLAECDCTTVDRIAMWMAQVGEESSGLKWMEEIASGSEYEGRTDLGNTQPGDGARFKGRGPIQVTGRHNYTVLSQWAFDKGLVPSPTFFVDDPAQLASTRYGFMGVTWYWTTQRPMNDAADAKDIVRATQYVNGGQNGIDDRRARYNRALGMGDELLALLTTSDTDPLEELPMSDLEVESLSLYATPGEPLIPIVRMLQAVDAAEHRWLVESAAALGDQDSLSRIARVAAGQGKYKDQGAINHARAILAQIEASNPAALQAVLNGAS